MIEKEGSILTVREDIKVFDCTIRDGGLVNNFQFTDEFVRVFGKKREPNVSPLSKKYADLAFNIQKRLEDIVILLAREAYKKNKIKNFCLAGGVAMNCKMNGELYRQRFVDKIFV